MGVNESLIKFLSKKELSLCTLDSNPNASLLRGNDNVSIGATYLRNQVGMH